MTEAEQPIDEMPIDEQPHAGDELVEGGDAASESTGEASAGAASEKEPRVKVAPPEPVVADEDAIPPKAWYILKVAVNRENSICDALRRRVKLEGLDEYFGEILVPTEDVREFNKNGKQRIVKRRLYPGYIVVEMSVTDDTWFIVRDIQGVGDFTGAAGKPTPLSDAEVSKILQMAKIGEEKAAAAPEIKTAIRFKVGDKVRVKEGYFQNFEGDVGTIDESSGRVTVMISIFGRQTPVELDHWQIEEV